MKKNEEIYSVNVEEDDAIDAFAEIKGMVVGSFNFEDESQNIININEPLVTQILTDENNPNVDTSIINQGFNRNIRGQTPNIDGEKFTIKRGYVFRESTLRKLMVLKANHEDINIYMNTIIDTAINHYYDFVMNNND